MAPGSRALKISQRRSDNLHRRVLRRNTFLLRPTGEETRRTGNYKQQASIAQNKAIANLSHQSQNTIRIKKAKQPFQK